MTSVYNPLDKINLGKSVADALLEQPARPLNAIEPFEGAGIYVLYYSGPNPAYAPISRANADEAQWPIYIGKAIPSGGRKGASLAAGLWSTGTASVTPKRVPQHLPSPIFKPDI
jgi:hypothetical protein